MEIGVQTFCTDQTMNPAQWAKSLEERGFDTLMLPEHPHVPIARSTPYPDAYGGGSIPDSYKRPFDPFVAASYALANSSTLKVGTGICLLAFRDPIVTAKAIASLDVLSGGRFLFGVGFGWNVDEFASHGQEFKHRHAVVREKIGAMKSLWRDEEASYSGKYVHIEPSWIYPKPVQNPHPPILVGGNGPVAMRHAIEWGDFWYPTPPAEDKHLDASVPLLRQMAEKAGRDPQSIGIGVGAASPDEDSLAAYLKAGVQYVNFRLHAKSPSDQLRDLDDCVRVRDAVMS